MKELQLLSSHSFESLQLATASETLELTLNGAQDSHKFLGHFHILFINMELVDRRQHWINMWWHALQSSYCRTKTRVHNDVGLGLRYRDYRHKPHGIFEGESQ